MATIDSAYYRQTAARLQGCPVAEFGAVVAEHKANMLATKFNEPSEKVFADNVSWMAQEIISRPGGRNYKEAADITDSDLQKLEALRTEYGFDYLKDLRITFTTTQDDKQLEYKQPLLTYLAGKKGDFTDYQTKVITQLVERLEAAGESYLLNIHYCMRASRGSTHNETKNIFHVLMEGALTPNKKEIADLVAPWLSKETYNLYATTASWEGSRGQTIYQPWDTRRNALHCAVASGNMENVAYALAKGAKQTTLSNTYGSTAFADAVERSDEPAYRAIALRLFDNALTLEKGLEILRQPTRWKKDGRRPIETLARLGDLPFVLAMAQANAGAPELAAHAFSYTARVTAGDRYTSRGADLLYHPPVELQQTKTEWHVTETGRMEDPFPYIRQAVFNLHPRTGVYDTYQDIFGRAVKFLIEKDALTAEDIPAYSLTDPRSLNFIFSMRAAAEAEKARNPDFLEKTATFTDSFAAEMKRAKGVTNGFRVLYDAQKPAETSAKAYAVQGFSTGKPLPVKAPLKFKKPASGKAP